jgi:hypothetical protein
MVRVRSGPQTAITRKPEDRNSANEGGKVANRIFSRAMVVGRTAALCVGLAVMLAMALGVASSAVAANGKPFLLGRNNVATAVNTLIKQGPGPALRLRVGAGQPPMAVNSAAQVANLNADKVDGMDASSFLTANAKATDADKIDGKDSAQFMTASTYFSTSPEMTGQNIGNGTGIHHAEFGCDTGDQLITGGYRWMVNATSVAVVGSWPSGNRWLVQWANTSDPNNPYPIQIYVKCADTAAPAHN